eukprot:15450931-Alexandrium_andersonii.AAC.1
MLVRAPKKPSVPERCGCCLLGKIRCSTPDLWRSRPLLELPARASVGRRQWCTNDGAQRARR